MSVLACLPTSQKQNGDGENRKKKKKKKEKKKEESIVVMACSRIHWNTRNED